MKKLVIATRKSKLALWQSEYVKAELNKHFPDIEIVLQEFMTKGDKILDVPLAKIGGKGLFTKELENAMAAGEAHLAVHSLKDVPTQFEEGFKLSAVTIREDARDAFLSMNYESLTELPQGAVVGTTSLRRRMEIKILRPDVVLKDLRGNVQTRIQKLKDGEYDAIILATAGIKRLGIEDCVNYFHPVSIHEMIPSMGQAALGIETTGNEEVEKIVSVLNDKNSIIETTIERDFVDTLQGGCQVPIGVKATIVDEDSVEVLAIVGLPDGTEFIKEELTISQSEYKKIGKELAQKFIDKGARELLKRAEEMAFK